MNLRNKKYLASVPKTAKKAKKKANLRDLKVEQETKTQRRRHKRIGVKDRSPSPPLKKGKKRGAGMISPDVMRYNKNKHVSYTYWNDPNELVDRLRLLIASQSAGHTGHTNEIASIIEELREADIIQ